MVAAKVRTSAILDHIRASKTNFNLSTAEVIRLSKAGVPDAVIQAMRDPSHVPEKAAAPAALAVALPDGMPFAIELSEDIRATPRSALR